MNWGISATFRGSFGIYTEQMFIVLSKVISTTVTSKVVDKFILIWCTLLLTRMDVPPDNLSPSNVCSWIEGMILYSVCHFA